MAKALDTRVVASAKLGDIRLSLNLKTATKTEDPETPGQYIETPIWMQQASIDYELKDADDNALGSRTLTHQTAGVEVKPNRATAISTVSAELVGWIRADKLAIADSED